MDYVTLVPWTPRTIPHDPEPDAPPTPSTLCGRTLELLLPICIKALRPFPEARRVLRLALLEFGSAMATG